jgi:hypothetical protein
MTAGNKQEATGNHGESTINGQDYFDIPKPQDHQVAVIGPWTDPLSPVN